MLNWLKSSPIAHRGYFNNITIIENTLEAFNEAIKNKFNIELDVQLSKDLEVVVAHDLHLKRIAHIDQKIIDLNYIDLKKIKLMNNETHIPLFKDVLKLVNGQVNLIIELKSIDKKHNQILVNKVLELLKNYQGQYVIQSFDPLLMYKVRKQEPKIIRGQLVYDFKDKKMPIIFKIALTRMWTNILSKPDYLNTDIHFSNKVIKRYLKKDKPVISFTAKNREDYQYYLQIYDNVIFEGFDPREIFNEQMILQK